MSWHYLQGQAVESWEANSSDGIPSVLSSMLPTLGKNSSNGNETDSCRASQSGMTCEPSMAIRGGEVWTSSPADSHAKTSLPQTKTAAALTTESEADSGKKWQGSLARYDRASSSWKTPQCWLIEGLEQSSVIWPRWGMMQDGECSELATPDCCTNENECGLLPTPLTNPSRRKLDANGKSVSAKGQSYGVSLAQLAGGEPCPRFQEWLMDWPPGWTATEPLATDKFRLWLDSHGKSYDENETARLVL